MGARFSSPVQDGPGAHLPPVQWVPALSRGVKNGRGVTPTPHPLLVAWLRKSRAIPLLPLWAVQPAKSLSACTRVHLTFTLYHDARYRDCDILRHVYMLGRGEGGLKLVYAQQGSLRPNLQTTAPGRWYVSNNPNFIGKTAIKPYFKSAQLFSYRRFEGTAVAQWLRCCATNRKVAGSIPDGVIGICD